MDSFPNDSDGEALQRIAELGLDMSKALPFEFFIHVGSKQSADVVVQILEKAKIADKLKIVYDEGELEVGEKLTEENKEFWPSWTVNVYRSMVPEHAKVIEFQEELSRLIKANGTPDGWGIMCN